MENKIDKFYLEKLDNSIKKTQNSKHEPEIPYKIINFSNENSSESLNKRLEIFKNPENKSSRLSVDNPFMNYIRSSEKPIKAALCKKDITLAQELRDHGFKVSPILIFDVIYKRDQETIENIIKFQFYSESNLQLTFWYLLYSGFLQAAHDLLDQEDCLMVYCPSTSFIDKYVVNAILHNNELMGTALDQAIKFALDDVACYIIRENSNLATLDRMKKGKERGCVNLMIIYWSGDLTSDAANISERKLNSAIWDELETNIKQSELNEFLSSIKPFNLLKYYLDNSMLIQCQTLIKCLAVRKDSVILKTILSDPQYSFLSYEYILNTRQVLTSENLCQALNQGNYAICSAILRRISGHLAINSTEIQQHLISLLDKGKTCLLAIEVISRISLKSWNFEITRELCVKLSSFIKKRREIVYCNAPVLFCVLVSELMLKFSKFSRHFKSKCFNVSVSYVSLVYNFQDFISDEESLSYYFTQTDSRKRSVLEIIAKNELYELLSKDNIGLIVTKLWFGSESYLGVHKASSIVTTALAPEGSDESLQFKTGVDKSKPYNFQLNQWTHICSNRFSAQGISILALIILYQIFLYSLVSKGSLVKSGQHLDEKNLFTIILIMIFGISCEQILIIIYRLINREKIRISMWQVNDWLIGLYIIFISAEVPYKLLRDDLITFESANMASGVIYSIMLFMLCMKFVHITMTSEAFGPFLSMALMIFKEILPFFVVYSGFILCMSSVFTLLFKSTTGYERVDLSLRTLYMATIGPFTINSFADNKMAFGAAVLALFLLLAHVLMLNLLVGIVSNVFNRFQNQVESQYRAVLIETYYKNLWSDYCGMLIFLPTPLNAVSLLLCPIIFGKNRLKWNKRITKVLHLFYAVPYFCLFLIVSCLALPLAYLRGFIIYGKTGVEIQVIEKVNIFDIPSEEEPQTVIRFSYKKCFLWTFIGIPWLLYALLRDSFHFWTLTYLDSSSTKIEDQISTIDENFIINFYKTIKVLKADTVTCEEFLNTFKEFDKILEPNTSFERNEEIVSTIKKFSSPWNNGKIELFRITEMFPKKLGSIYDEEYLNMFKFANLSWIYKGLASFQSKNSKMFNSREKSGRDCKFEFEEEMEKVEKLVQEQKNKIKMIIKECQVISRNNI